MNTTGELTGKAYTADPQYYEFLGAPKQGICYDWARRCWVEATFRSPKTPADAVTPADVNAQLEPEPWKMENTQIAKAQVACRQKAADRHAAIQDVLVAYLVEHGPSPSAELAKGTGINYSTIKPHMSQRSGTIYVRLYAADRRRKLWGLIGIHTQEAA